MTNHPNRSNTSFRFIAFGTITGQSLAHAETAAAALASATSEPGIMPDFIEVLDCGENGRKVWTGGQDPSAPVPLHRARLLHPTVFRGDGYADGPNPLPAIPMAS